MFVAQPFIVRGDSMQPTFESGEYLIVDQWSYHFNNPARGDVIIMRYPKDTSVFFIKRIIGLPGETVQLSGGKVTIEKQGQPSITLTEPYVEDGHLENEYATYTLGSRRLLRHGRQPHREFRLARVGSPAARGYRRARVAAFVAAVPRCRLPRRYQLFKLILCAIFERGRERESLDAAIASVARAYGFSTPPS